MHIKELSTLIDKKNVGDGLIIFKNPKDSSFLSKQYIDDIATSRGMRHARITSLPTDTSADAFSIIAQDTIGIYITDKLECSPSIINAKNIIICCNTIQKKLEELLTGHIVVVPDKFEDWQLKDYVYSYLEGLSDYNKDWLVAMCGKSIDRLSLEVERLSIFTTEERNAMFEEFKKDGIYDDLTDKTMYDFIDSVITKDKALFIETYHRLADYGATSVGTLTLLYNSIRNLIKVKVPLVTSADACGINAYVYNMYKRKQNVFSELQLMAILTTLTETDYLIKDGKLSTDNLIDYLIIRIFTV